MATAGSIVVDLLMRTGSFETDTQRASKSAQRQMKELEREVNKVGSTIGVAFAGITAAVGVGLGVAFNKFITETRNAQDEQAQLAAALRSTGEAAGFTIGQLNDMATQFASASTFSEGDINKAQTRLLSYTGIVGEQFPRAMQAVIDTSARMGMSVEQAAETVGRALDIPSQGLSSLSRQGFRFTEEQKKLVESLEATGRVGEAQAVVLSALESSYGGAAAAARNTLGGALTALQNQIDSLMTGDDGSVSGLTSQINGLTNILGSSETRQAFSDFLSWMTSTATSLVGIINTFNQAVIAADGWVLALEGAVADSIFGNSNPAKEVDELTSKINEHRVAYQKLKDEYAANPSGVAKNFAGFDTPQNYESRMAALDNAIKAGEARLVYARSRMGVAAITEAQVPTLAATDVFGDGGRKPPKKPITKTRGSPEEIDQGQRLIDQMNERIALIGKETEYEQLLAKISVGSVKFREDGQKKIALGHAQTLDTMAAEQRVFEETQEMFKSFSKINEDTLKQTNEFTIQAARNIETYMGDGLYDVLSGNFDDIGKSFASMVARMAAEAAAANLSQALLGDYGKTKQIGGLFGSMAAMFAGSAITAASGVTIGGAPNAVGSTAGMSYLPPFAAGGYTGPGGKFDVAGVVHAGEYVFDAESTRRLGVGNLEALRGYADGGYVGNAPTPVSFNGSRTGDIAVTVNVSGQGSSVSTTGDQQNQFGQDLAAAVKATVRAEIARSYRQGGLAYNKSIGR